MKQHQELLELSRLKPSNETEIITTSTNLIQFSPAIVSKSNGTLIITLQTSTATSETELTVDDANITDNAHETDLTSTHYEIVEEPHVYAKTPSTPHILDECPARINSICIERELDELNDITIDSDTEGNEDNDGNVIDENATNAINDVVQEKFKDFPKLIEDSKLLYVFESTEICKNYFDSDRFLFVIFPKGTKDMTC